MSVKGFLRTAKLGTSLFFQLKKFTVLNTRLYFVERNNFSLGSPGRLGVGLLEKFRYVVSMMMMMAERQDEVDVKVHLIFFSVSF